MSLKLVIFGLEGILITTKSGQTFRQNPADWQWLPRRLEHIRKLHQQNVIVALASNQGGVAFAKLDYREMEEQLAIQCQQAEIDMSLAFRCYSHENGFEGWNDPVDLFNRKPNPGMIYKAMLTAQACVQEVLMIGNRPEDVQAARHAGTSYQSAEIYFGENTHPF